MREVDERETRQAEASGAADVPLLPGPAWFLTEMQPMMLTPGRWCLPRLYRLDREIPFEAVRAAVGLAWRRHEALRSAFTPDPGESGGWRQSIAPADTPPPLRRLDLSGLSEAAVEEEVGDAVVEICGSMQVGCGPLVKFLYFRTTEPQPALLAVVSHHLVSDLISTTIVKADLEQMLSSWHRRSEHALAPHGPTYREYARALRAYAQSPEMERELGYWLDQPWDQMVELPRDHLVHSDDSVRSSAVLHTSVGHDEIEHSAGNLGESMGAQAEWLLLGALSEVMTAWAGGGVCFEVVHHARNILRPGGGADGGGSLPRTPPRMVGWLATGGRLPMLPRHGESLLDYMHAARRRALAAPNRGTGIGLLRWVAPATSRDEGFATLYRKARVRFIYSGTVGTEAKQNGPLEPVELSKWLRMDPLEPRIPLQIRAATQKDRIHILWDYDPRQHQQETIQALAQEVHKVIIATAGAFTP